MRRSIDVQLEGTPGNPRPCMGGSSPTSRAAASISVFNPPPRNPSHYITASGPMRKREACDSQRNGRYLLVLSGASLRSFKLVSDVCSLVIESLDHLQPY